MKLKLSLSFAILHFFLVGIIPLFIKNNMEAGMYILFLDLPLFIIARTFFERLLFNNEYFGYILFAGFGTLMYALFGYLIGLTLERFKTKHPKE